ETSAAPTGDAAPPADLDQLRHRQLSPFWWTVLLGATFASVAMSIYVIFNLGITFGYVPLETEYFYMMVAVLLPLAFVLYPPWPGVGPMDRVPWYDILGAAAVFGVTFWFVLNSIDILESGWEFLAPPEATFLAFVLWALVLEATRRAGGMSIFVICLLISVYPVFAGHAPGILSGQSVAWTTTANYHMFGTESVFGIPLKAFATLVIGFLIFGVALQHTGGGAFFLNLAFALLGRYRGGPAKVAIFASGLMGSMSGSVITNVLTTGVMTIPAMKRVGFRPSYAAGVEACASTGGVLMPPIMGATAFIMATFLEIPYVTIAIAAVIPSILYYLALFIQIDAYAARHELAGLPPADLPRIATVMKEGWYFVAVFVLLIVMLIYMQQEAQAPYYATALLLLINQTMPRHRWNLRRLFDFMAGTGRLFTELAAILAGIGLIIGSLSLTGKVGSIAFDLVSLAGDSVLLLLLMGAVTSFILGIGMTVTAAYIFLAITLAPALTAGGLDLLAVHLFMLYWGMISYITPPVAIGAFTAASLAGANGMRTGLEAMRLGAIIYFVPFFFVLNPALIGHGSPGEVVHVFVAAVAGTLLIAASLQSYLLGVGRLDTSPVLHWPIRVGLCLAGIVMALPGGEIVGYTNAELNLAAIAFGVP